MNNKPKFTTKKLLKHAFRSTVPVLTGYAVLGFGFGFILKTNGYSTLLAVAMSLFVYAGSMQYAAISLFSGGASALAVALTTLTVNIRHLFYGISMLDKYKNAGKKKPYLIFSLTDETYSLVCGNNKDIPQSDKINYYFYVSLLNHIYWITGTLFGAAAGDVIKFNSNGIDFALTALFLTVFIEQWLSTKNHTPALVGLFVSLICLILFGKEAFLIPSMIIITAIFIFYKEDNKIE